jgi:HAD superfamily hydrolase (TIGR01509 family)
LTNNGPFLAAALPQFFPEATELFGEDCYFSGLLGKSKPDPAAFLEVCARLQVGPGNTLFIDDYPNYISGAQEAGLLVHHFSDHANLLPVLRAHELVA